MIQDQNFDFDFAFAFALFMIQAIQKLEEKNQYIYD